MKFHFFTFSLVLFSIGVSFGQSDKRMDYFPATQKHFAGLNVYSTATAEFNQFYVQDGQWVKNNLIPQPNVSVRGGDYRMKFLPGSDSAFHGLFAYSRKTGQFEFLYLDENGWKSNPYFPKSSIKFGSSDTVLEFMPAQNDEVAYISAYSVDGNHFGIYYVNGDQWVKSNKFPQ
jgi:hypothetical protein